MSDFDLLLSVERTGKLNPERRGKFWSRRFRRESQRFAVLVFEKIKNVERQMLRRI